MAGAEGGGHADAPIRSGYQAGHDGFSRHRTLEKQGIGKGRLLTEPWRDKPMGTFLAHWAPTEILFLFGLCALVVSILALILAVYRYNVRALADQTALQRDRQQAEMALKRELIQRGLPAQELERYVDLLRLADQQPASPTSFKPASPSPSREGAGFSDEGLRAQLAQSIASLEDVSAEEIEQTLALVMAVDRDRQTAVLNLIEELSANETNPEATLAAVRALCRPSQVSSRVTTAPGSAANLTPTA